MANSSSGNTYVPGGGGGGGIARYVVAASNTPNAAARANLLCTGTADDATIQTAVAALSGPAEFDLLEGDYFFTVSGITPTDGLHFRGVGFSIDGQQIPQKGTIIHGSTGVACFNYNPTDVVGTAVTFTAGLAANAVSGTLTAAVTNGFYVCRFNESAAGNPVGEARTVTVTGGTTVNWPAGQGLAFAAVAGATFYLIQQSNAAFLTAALKGVIIEDIGFDVGANGYAIKFGSRFNPGILGGAVRRIGVGSKTAASWAWGVYFENCQYTNIEQINLLGPVTQTGAFYFGSSSGANNQYDPTNSSITNINVTQGASSIAARNFVIEARDTGYINDLNIFHVSSINANPSTATSKTSTVTTGSPNVVLQSGGGASFPVGMPCTVSSLCGAGTNSFTPNITYFVVSQISDTIQLSYVKNGAPITPSGGSGSPWTPNVTTFGQSSMEVISLQDGPSLIQGVNAYGLDLEGPNCASIIAQHARMDMSFNNVTSTQGVDSYSSIVARSGCQGRYSSKTQMVLDIDNSSAGLVADGVALATISGGALPGILLQPGTPTMPTGLFGQGVLGTGQFSLGGVVSSVGPYFNMANVPNVSGGPFCYPYVAFGDHYEEQSGNPTLGGNDCGVIVDTSGNTTQTWTLPTLTASNCGTAGSSASLLGIRYYAVNAGFGTLVINAGGTNYIGRCPAAGGATGGLTSVTLFPGESILLTPAHDTSPAYGWGVLAASDRLFNRLCLSLNANDSINGTSNTVLTADASLTFTLPYVGRYELDGLLLISEATSGAGGFQFDFGTGTATVGDFQAIVDQYGTAITETAAITSVITATSIATVSINAAAPSWARIQGTFYVSSLSGGHTFGLRWAQASSSVNTTSILKGSYLKASRIAMN